jgi:hypothetical protein
VHGPGGNDADRDREDTNTFENGRLILLKISPRGRIASGSLLLWYRLGTGITMAGGKAMCNGGVTAKVVEKHLNSNCD